jgi:deazaflavin-dependent oxidoreductase (nitroreductase family)
VFVKLLQVLGGIAAVGGVVWIAFVVSLRTRFRPVQDAIRRMNRAVTNPRQLRSAGQPGAYAAVVHHRGRTSGTAYRTPVVAVPADGCFAIALPYGPGADWVRNVLAAGTATLQHEGRTDPVAGPELVRAADANPFFPAKEQRMHRLYGVDDFLLLQEASQT